MLLRMTLVFLLLTAGADADPLLEQRLAGQAPLLTQRTARPGLAIDGNVEWWDDFYVTFEVRARPRFNSMTLRCEVDGTPLLICLNDSALMYDVPAARYLWLRGCVMRFTFGQAENGPELHATVAPRSRLRRDHEIEVDLRSIFAADDATLKAEQTGDEEYLLIAMDAENETMNAAAVDLAQKPPFIHYESSVFDTERPWLVLSRMGLNSEPSDASGSGLSADLLRAGGIEVIEHPVGSWSHGLVSEVMDGWYFLHGFGHAPTRTQMEAHYGRVGWHQLRRKHEEIRGRMRQLLDAPPATQPTTQSEADAEDEDPATRPNAEET